MKRRVLFIVLALAVVIALLATWSYLYIRSPVPPQGPQIATPANTTLNLSPPTCPSQNGSYTNKTVGSVHFSLHLVEWCSFGPQVNGTGVEPSGVAYPFQLGSAAHSSTGWINWTSPDGMFGVD